MLELHVPAQEYFNEETNEFITVKATTLKLEHSLISLAKWESRWLKPFLANDAKTNEETLDYIRCMSIMQIDPSVVTGLTPELLEQVTEYINAPMTATTITDRSNVKPKSEVITAEVIYYWMITLNIPFECEKWHLARLLALLEVCSIKNSPHGKMTKAETLMSNAQLNALRRQQLGTTG